MYRVVQNILENALKYSLKGTRIFATISNQGSRVCLTVQNTSGYEMNFTEEEIMERFYRGENPGPVKGTAWDSRSQTALLQTAGENLRSGSTEISLRL